MDSTSTKSLSSTESFPATTLSAKLRRLKIEENVLLQSLNKCVPECSEIDNAVDSSYKIFSDFKSFSSQTKESYRHIKLLFDDIKTSTSSKELLKTLDIDEVKKSTLELENCIKSFKSHLQSELACLKFAEKQLNEGLNESPIAINKLKRRPRVQTAKYNEIVPSPVKTLMTSPLKCAEVQQFQDFMLNSGNRYGGWDQYHHNLFINYWKKHFTCLSNASSECELPEQNSPEFNSFLRELLPKLHDISEEEVLAHAEWYLKYLYLKERQQNAIDKWRRNRQIMKSAKVKNEKPTQKKNSKAKTVNRKMDITNIVSDALTNMKESPVDSPILREEPRCFIRKCWSDDMKTDMNDKDHFTLNMFLDEISTTSVDSANIGKETSLHFQKPTKQWNLKLATKNDQPEMCISSDLNKIKKLRTPTWRLGL